MAWRVLQLVLAAAILGGWAAMALIRPTGEGWGRGWNLIAWWLYITAGVWALTLATAITAIVSALRRPGTDRGRWWPWLVAAGVLHPAVSVAILRLLAGR